MKDLLLKDTAVIFVVGGPGCGKGTVGQWVQWDPDTATENIQYSRKLTGS